MVAQVRTCNVSFARVNVTRRCRSTGPQRSVKIGVNRIQYGLGCHMQNALRTPIGTHSARRAKPAVWRGACNLRCTIMGLKLGMTKAPPYIVNPRDSCVQARSTLRLVLGLSQSGPPRARRCARRPCESLDLIIICSADRALSSVRSNACLVSTCQAREATKPWTQWRHVCILEIGRPDAGLSCPSSFAPRHCCSPHGDTQLSRYVCAHTAYPCAASGVRVVMYK